MPQKFYLHAYAWYWPIKCFTLEGVGLKPASVSAFKKIHAKSLMITGLKKGLTYKYERLTMLSHLTNIAFNSRATPLQ